MLARLETEAFKAAKTCVIDGQKNVVVRFTQMAQRCVTDGKKCAFDASVVD
jgi:hypothetical protein